MSWRTQGILQPAPMAVAVITAMEGPNRYVTLVLVAGDLVWLDTNANANAVDAAAIAWVGGLGVVQLNPREVSAVRCGRNDQGAHVMYHMRDTIVLTPAQVAALAQAVPQALQQTVDALKAQLGPGYQAIVSRWQADQTIRWDALVGDATHVQNNAGPYQPLYY